MSLGDRDDEPEVLLDELLPGSLVAGLGASAELYLLPARQETVTGYAVKVSRKRIEGPEIPSQRGLLEYRFGRRTVSPEGVHNRSHVRSSRLTRRVLKNPVGVSSCLRYVGVPTQRTQALAGHSPEEFCRSTLSKPRRSTAVQGCAALCPQRRSVPGAARI